MSMFKSFNFDYLFEKDTVYTVSIRILYEILFSLDEWVTRSRIRKEDFWEVWRSCSFHHRLRRVQAVILISYSLHETTSQTAIYYHVQRIIW